MFGKDYGPFATTITYAAVLITLFSALLLKAVGKVSRWTFLAGGSDYSPSFLVTAGVRALAIALIVLTFALIDKSNYLWFGGAAAACGLLMIILIGKFDEARQAHSCKVPELEVDGTVRRGWLGGKKSYVVLIGTEDEMRPDAAAAYQAAGSPGLCKFLSGYGVHQVNNPEAIWPKQLLASISSKMNLTLMGILLFGVMALYLAAAALEVHQR